jgi:hypothetical protein
MKRVMFVVCALCVLPGFLLFPQEELNGVPVYTYPKLKLNFPFFDHPYQIDTMDTSGYGFFGSYTSPSMNQSLALSMDIYSSLHFGMRKLYDDSGISSMWKEAIYYGGSVAGILAFAYVLPFGYPWMQREFTRSILSRFDIKSVNGDYDIFSPTLVVGVTDSQLEHFKAESPHDMTRMDESGSEGYILFSDFMLRNVFFYDLHNLSNWTALIAAFLGSFGKNVVGVVAEYMGADYVDTNLYKSINA